MAQAASAIRYLRRNGRLLVGIILLLILFLFAFVGRLFVDGNDAYPLSAPANLAPTLEYPFGTDSQGRDLLAVGVMGTYLTTKIGVVAGSLGLGFGTILGFLAAYYGGVLDTVVRWVVDVLLTIPSLLVLVVIASTFQGGIDVNGMALVVALLAWMWPARVIRSQVLTMKQRAFVRVAQLSGSSNLEIIFKELMPIYSRSGRQPGRLGDGANLCVARLEALGWGPCASPPWG